MTYLFTPSLSISPIIGLMGPYWANANIALIPKRGHPLALDHLRPISLTSSMGEVFEHVIHARLVKCVAETGAVPHSMIDFRVGLSTQDMHLHLLHDIIAPRSKVDAAAILTLDLT